MRRPVSRPRPVEWIRHVIDYGGRVGAGMQIVVISGLPDEAIAARGGLPPLAHLLKKPINFDWLQGYLVALVAANANWR